ncbi:MAG TPA: AMP-binding protein [Variovorax sp.]|nr:AMP-binding protein [Variovorax sp.]
MDRPHRPRRLADLLVRWSEIRPGHTALKTPEVALTFAELLAQTHSAQDELRALGVVAGDVVAFQLPNWVDAFVLYHALLGMEAIALPLMPALRDRELAYMLEEVRARLFVTLPVWRGFDHAAMARRVCGPSTRTVLMREPNDGGALLRVPDASEDILLEDTAPRPTLPTGVCSVIFTSGTSGRPKAVLYTHDGLGIEGREMAAADAICGDDVLFVPPAVGHVSGLSFGIHMAMHAGATVCLLPDWTPETAVALIERERCTWTAGATPFLQGVVAAATERPEALASLRVFRCGGASVPPGLVRQARALGIDAYRSYGLSEHPTVSGRAGQPDEVCVQADGTVHPLIEVRIADPDHPADPARDRAPGEVGEILTRGPDLSPGYLRADDTAASRVDGWLLTGDLGTFSADRVLRITGRRKDMIIRKGENISAREIEDLLLAHPALADVAVVGVPDAERGEMVCCVAVRRAGRSVTLAELCSHLRGEGLATFKLPERLVIWPELPCNAGGKVLKRLIREMLAGT